jgi:hypothetical protein
MLVETLVRRARWGVELVDALRGGGLLSTPRLRTVGTTGHVLRANDSRWFLEDVPPGTYTLRVEAAGYVPTEVQRTIAGADPGVLDLVDLLPAPGYSFAPTTRRVAGELRVLTADGEPAVDASVSFTVITGPGAAGRTETRSVAGGLYTMWLDPGAPSSLGDPAYPSRMRVDAELVRGVTTFAGTVTFDLDPTAIVNGVPTVTLT